MKNIKLSVILSIALIAFAPTTEIKAQSVSINFSTFHQALSPYGRWVNNPRFGQVWICNTQGFQPYYSNGHWEYTNYGWSWVSDYDWGWAPFHYGRWEYDDYDGWMWIPGYDWASAWVSWSSYDDYYGWAPLGYGVNINVSFGSIPYNRWTFIPRRNICDRDINRYYISPQRNYGFRNAVCINNYYEGREGRFMRGPERREAERYTRRNITERNIDNNERQGRFNNNDRNRNNDRRVVDNNGNDRRNNDRPARIDNGNTVNDNFPRRRPVDDVNNNTNNNNGYGRRNNDKPARVDDGNTGNENFPRRKPVVDDVNNSTNDNNGYGRRNREQPVRTDNNLPSDQNNSRWSRRNDNSVDRNNNQPDNFPRRPQQIERPGRKQNDQPVIPERKMERRSDNTNSRSWQNSNSNDERQIINPGGKRRGNN